MVKSNIHPFFVVLLAGLWCLLLVTGCKDDDDNDLTTPSEQFSAPPGDECRDSFCPGVADCINGYCHCTDTTLQIARGICIQNPDRVIFVSYDTIPRIVDTIVLELENEPFETTWQIGESAFKSAGPGHIYKRDIRRLGIGERSSVTYVWPGDLTTPVDTVWIFDIHDGEHDIHGYRYNEDWRYAARMFEGKFTDRNTIEGNMVCWDRRTRNENPTPDSIPRTLEFPMTFHRWER